VVVGRRILETPLSPVHTTADHREARAGLVLPFVLPAAFLRIER